MAWCLQSHSDLLKEGKEKLLQISKGDADKDWINFEQQQSTWALEATLKLWKGLICVLWPMMHLSLVASFGLQRTPSFFESFVPVSVVIGVLRIHRYYSGTTMSVLWCTVCQVSVHFAVQLLIVSASLQMPSELMRHRVFLSAYVPSLAHMCLIGYCPPTVFLYTVCPGSMIIWLAFHVHVGFMPSSMVMWGIMQSAVMYGVFKMLVDHRWKAFQDAAELKRHKHMLEATQATLDGMLSSVFDASCVCDSRGILQSCTQQFQHLLGAGRGITEQLGDLTTTDGERERLRDFLQHTSTVAFNQATKIQVSLQPLSEQQLSQQPEANVQSKSPSLEVDLYGILLPASAVASSLRGKMNSSRPEQIQDEITITCAPPDIHLFVGIRTVATVWPSNGDADDPEQPSYVDADDPEQSELCSYWPKLHDEHPSRHTVHDEADGNETYITSASGKRAASIDPSRSGWSCPCFRQESLPHMSPCGQNGGDCLPSTATVWVEGSPAPVALNNVKSGQKVLCYDNLTKQVQYAAVNGVNLFKSNEVPWVAVNLADGTSLEMTADHPVEPHKQTGHIRAADLRPEKHQLMVVKLAPVSVISVEKVEPKCPTRVALCLSQPHRMAVFASASPQSWATMAVGSADAGMTAPLQVRERRGFLEVQPASCITQRRSSSLPPQLERQSITAQSAYIQKDREPTTCTLETRSQCVSEQSAQSSLSIVQSSTSSLSSKESATMLLVGFQPTPLMEEHLPNSSMTQRTRNMLQLSDYMHLKDLGVPTIGSIAHVNTSGGLYRECSPCVFDFKHRVKNRAKPCWKSFLCERCHVCNVPLQAMQKRKKA